MGLAYKCKAGNASARPKENLRAGSFREKKSQPKEIHERAPVAVRDEEEECFRIVVVKGNCCPWLAPAARARNRSGSMGGMSDERGGLEGTLRLTSSRRRHRVVEDQPATLHETGFVISL